MKQRLGCWGWQCLRYSVSSQTDSQEVVVCREKTSKVLSDSRKVAGRRQRLQLMANRKLFRIAK